MRPEPEKNATAAPLRHLAVIMDGNGRWAKRRLLPRKAGHRAGAKNLRRLCQMCGQAGISYLTVYAFSTENWKRPEDEVATLMRLFIEFLNDYDREMESEGIRLRVLGDVSGLPANVRESMLAAEERSRGRERLQLILALNYGGRAEIAAAVNRIAERVLQGELIPGQIDETTVARHLYLPDVPDPDLIIRPSGEQRLSNFLLWQGAYSELWFSDVLWPDFRQVDFDRALAAYSERERRFGGLK